MNQHSALQRISDLSIKKNESEKAYVDRIITVSTAALALSATFRTTISGEGSTHIWLLQAAWIGFAISLILGVTMQLMTASACKRLIQALKKDPYAHSAAPHPIFLLLWYIMFISFPLSFIALAVFAIINAS